MVEERASGEVGRLVPATTAPGPSDQLEQPTDNATVDQTKQDAGRELVTKEKNEVRIFADKLEPAMDKTFRYVVRRGLLVLLAVRPLYKTLQRLSKFQCGERISFRIPLLFWLIALFASRKTRITLIYCKPQLVLEGGKLACSLSARSSIRRVLSWIAPKSLMSRFDAAVIKATKEPLFHADLKSAPRAPIMLMLVLISILGSLIIVLSIPLYVGLTLVRGLIITFRSALRSLPSVYVLLIVIFITGDAWRIFGLESGWQFAALVLFATVTSIAAVIVSLRGPKGGWRSNADYSSKDLEPLKTWANEVKQARPLVDMEVKPVLPPPPPGKSQDAPASEDSSFENKLLKAHEKNISILYFIAMVSSVIAVAFWASLTFVIIGVITVNAALTKELSHAHADVLTQFNLVGQSFIVTRQLVLLSVILGSIAALSFASTTLQHDDERHEFASYALTDLKRALGALAYYYGATLMLLRKLASTGIFGELRGLFTREGLSNLHDYVEESSRLWSERSDESASSNSGSHQAVVRDPAAERGSGPR